MASGQFGGRITFNFAGTYIPPSEGEFVLDPALYTKESKTNQDGSQAIMLKPKQPGCEVKLRNVKGFDWQAVMTLTGNVTIIEQDNGVTHLFTNTTLVGEPKINLVTGEVDGLKVEGGTYQMVAV